MEKTTMDGVYFHVVKRCYRVPEIYEKEDRPLSASGGCGPANDKEMQCRVFAYTISQRNYGGLKGDS